MPFEPLSCASRLVASLPVAVADRSTPLGMSVVVVAVGERGTRLMWGLPAAAVGGDEGWPSV